MAEPDRRIAELLDELANGSQIAADKLFPLIYDELHRLAQAYMDRERRDHTLQPTALINEAYLRLVKPPADSDDSARQFESKSHFVSTAAVVMRRVLINHARAKNADKRRAERSPIPIDEIEQTFQTRAIDLLALDEALQELKSLDPLQHRLVELRFFGGLTVEQCAPLLDASPRKLAYEWAHARAWLRGKLDDQQEGAMH